MAMENLDYNPLEVGGWYELTETIDARDAKLDGYPGADKMKTGFILTAGTRIAKLENEEVKNEADIRVTWKARGASGTATIRKADFRDNVEKERRKKTYAYDGPDRLGEIFNPNDAAVKVRPGETVQAIRANAHPQLIKALSTVKGL